MVITIINPEVAAIGPLGRLRLIILILKPMAAAKD